MNLKLENEMNTYKADDSETSNNPSEELLVIKLVSVTKESADRAWHAFAEK